MASESNYAVRARSYQKQVARPAEDQQSARKSRQERDDASKRQSPLERHLQQEKEQS